MKKIMLSIGAAAAAFLAFSAEVKPLSPVNGESVRLLPTEQKKVMALPTYEERLDWLKKDCAARKAKRQKPGRWRIAKPVTLRWTTPLEVKGPFRILLGTRPDLSDAKRFSTNGNQVKKDVKAKIREFTYHLPFANPELGVTYYWRVCADVKCPFHKSHGFKPCACAKRPGERLSPIASFVTDPQPPRWIAIEGRVRNIRDLGGWKTLDGRRVRQGRAFRGQGLNDNSETGECQGRNRLMVEDLGFFRNTLKIKTDLDLRTSRETATLDRSPLGEGVRFIRRSSPAYREIFRPKGMKTMAENFRVFCDAANYPIYFHCIGGADRTGSLAYVLNGILGVPRHELEVDWESTFYPSLPEMSSSYPGEDYWRREQHFNNGFAKYGDKDTPWNKRIELYLLDCGVKPEEIEKFRSLMLTSEE